MSDDAAKSMDPGQPEICPHCETPVNFRDRVRGVANRLRDAASTVGGEVMIDLPSRLGDHEGLLLALANELEQLVG